MSLTVVETHPVQYHAPVYRAVQSRHNIPVKVIYGSDFSVAGYHDAEFGAQFSWETDLLSGYQPEFLSRTRDGGANTMEAVRASGLSAALHKAQPTALLLPGYNQPIYRRALLLAAGRRIPLMLRGETTDHDRARSILRRMTRDAYLRLVYASADAFLYIGERSRMHYERLRVPEKKLFFSPYCVDITPFQCDEAARTRLRAATRSELAIRDDALVLLFSGKLVPRKDPARIVDAARALGRPFGDVVIVYLGDGPLHDEISRAATLDPPVDVRIIGFRNQRALSAYYHASDMLILPSLRYETWGLVVNEALHHGVPCVVSSAVGCADDLIETGETGFVFDAGDTNGLKQAISQCTDLTNRPAARERCRAVVAGYSIDAAAAGIAAAYNAVTGKRDA